MKRLYGYLYEPVLALPFALGLTLLFHGVFGAPKAADGEDRARPRQSS